MQKIKDMRAKKGGFTLIELLIVIAIIAILAAVIFVALNPLQRFQDARDSRRWSEINNLMLALKVDQIDNGGNYIGAVTSTVVGDVYMIVNGATASGCDDQNTQCDTAITSDTHCIDISGLVTEGYLADVPVSPNGDGNWGATITGYTLERTTSSAINIRSCESENSSEIFVVR